MHTNADHSLYRLMSWLSPSFPVGAYSYSHGIEYAFDAGDVTNADSLQTWVEGILEFGAGRLDAVFFRAGWQAITERDNALLKWTIETAETMRATKEMALESSAQGEAFFDTLLNSWPVDGLDRIEFLRVELKRTITYPVAVGIASALSEIELHKALEAYLHAFVSNLVSAGVRMIPLGQTAGQQIISSLEIAVIEAVHSIMAETMETLKANLGSGAVMVDWSSMKHETQYTRIFRS